MDERRRIPSTLMRHLPEASSLLHLGQERLELFLMALTKSADLLLVHALDDSLGIQCHLLEVPHVLQHDVERSLTLSQCTLSRLTGALCNRSCGPSSTVPLATTRHLIIFD